MGAGRGALMPALANLTNAESAERIGDLITRKSTSITIVRAGAAIAAQTVRLETLSSQKAIMDNGGITYMCDAMLLGYKNHATVTDTSIKAGDRFRANSVDYEVIAILPAHTDCVQAYLLVRS